ncbi:glycosyltransferase [Desulfomarina sp.]
MVRFSVSVKKTITRCQLALTNPGYRLIRRSKLFDHDYYRKANPDIDEEKTDLLVHFLRWGDRERRSPSIYFSPHYYLSRFSEKERDSIVPLFHFLREGGSAGNDPNPLFHMEYYLRRYPDVAAAQENPLVYYLKYGWKKGQITSPEMEYLLEDSLFKSLLERNINPLGFLLARKPYPGFDPEYYLDRTPAVVGSGLSPWEHYMHYGAAEGKSPFPLFDPHWYRMQYPEISVYCRDLYSHFQAGNNATRFRPSEWFDPGFYRQQSLTCENESKNPLVHYLGRGVFSGCYTDARVAGLPEKPLISVIVPVYNVKACYLNNCIRSVLHQTYPHWELCLADDCSTEEHIRPLLEKWRRKDLRINVVYLEKNKGIAGATEEAVKIAAGDYFAFLDNDDELTVDALYQVVRAIFEDGADLLYSDEDLIGDDGTCFNTFYKPDYNRELLLCHNYITHLLVVSRELYKSSGGVCSELDGAQDYDLVLKLCHNAKKVVHISKVLYHWRASETSTSVNHLQKSYADLAGKKAVERALVRLERKGEVVATEWKFFYNPRYDILPLYRVSIIVTRLETVENITDYVKELCSRTGYKHFEVILLLDESSEMDEREDIQAAERSRVLSLFFSENDSIACRLNRAASQASGEFLVFLDGSCTVAGEQWLESFLGFAGFEDVGFVTGLVALGEHGKMSRVPDIQDCSPGYYLQWIAGCSVHMNGLQCSQQVMMVSGDFCLVRKTLFEQFGGVKEELFPVLFGLCDLSLEIHEHGLKNIFCTDSRIIPVDTDLPGRTENDGSEAGLERARFQKKWSAVLQSGDPYYNPGCYREAGLEDDEFARWYRGDFTNYGSEAIKS